MKTQPKVLSTVILLAPFIFSFAFAMDIYIPVVPAMKAYFHSSQADIQLTLSLFMIITGLGQLIVGPTTDNYGRKTILMLGAMLFAIGSLLCSIAPSFAILLIGRIVEAAGGCAMMVVANAIVRDQFSGNEATKIYSFLNCGVAMSPLFAPIIGSYLGAWFGWRAGFIFLTVLGLIVLGLAFMRIKETLDPKNRVPLNSEIFLRYWHILSNKTFLVFTCCTTAGLTIFFVFFSSSPYIVINLLHAPVEHFGYYFFTVGAAFFVGSLISGKIADSLGAYRTALIGSVIMLSAGLVMWVWYALGGLSTMQYLVPCMIAGIGGSLMMGAGAGGAMEPFAKSAGSAAALVGCLQFLVSAAIGSFVMHWEIHSTIPLAITITSSSLLALIILCLHKMIKDKV